VPAPLFSQVTGLRRGRGPSDVTSMSRRRRRAFPASRGVVVLRVHVGPHRQGGVRVTEPGGDDRDGHALEVQERAAGVGSQPRRWCRRAGVVAAARTRRGTGRSGVGPPVAARPFRACRIRRWPWRPHRSRPTGAFNATPLGRHTGNAIFNLHRRPGGPWGTAVVGLGIKQDLRWMQA
jgi:hypothetical protein